MVKAPRPSGLAIIWYRHEVGHRQDGETLASTRGSAGGQRLAILP
jgi:hypothetical protein